MGRGDSWAAAMKAARRGGLIWVCVEGPEAPMGAEASFDPLSGQTRVVRKGAQLEAAPVCSLGHSTGSGGVCASFLLARGVLEHMLCCSTGGTGRDSPAAALDPCWKHPCPCTCGTRTRSRKGASLTRQCLTQGRDILSCPLTLPGAVLCPGWHHHCQWPRLSWWSSLSGRS